MGSPLPFGVPFLFGALQTKRIALEGPIIPTNPVVAENMRDLLTWKVVCSVHSTALKVSLHLLQEFSIAAKYPLFELMVGWLNQSSIQSFALLNYFNKAYTSDKYSECIVTLAFG